LRAFAPAITIWALMGADAKPQVTPQKPPATDIEIAVARPNERDLIANLFQLYIHDFSQFWAATPDGELNDDGRFEAYRPLDLYWREADRIPLLFRKDGRPIGFALLNGTSHSGLPADRNMAEFFIVRKHRRGGVGTRAARAVFRLYPGLWEVAVARKNLDALAFWRRAIEGCPGVQEVDETDHHGPGWNGPIIRFRVTPGA
jgi:predicted acetyltransferase